MPAGGCPLRVGHRRLPLQAALAATYCPCKRLGHGWSPLQWEVLVKLGKDGQRLVYYSSHILNGPKEHYPPIERCWKTSTGASHAQ
ncbi:hypothetical protein BHE74_00053076 [Ensete ventricosum]|nr:hypothetical protein GW17_00018235 [Ensete ventricosum]RWW41442.1 hypothetical protein BHE74_00053076 [Ensete ventricosum]RZR88452.1 hypothetical protein BHM03_00016043 [Ensete ventricosum]